MMREIRLVPDKCTPELATMLEGRGLISFIHHAPHAARISIKEDYIKGEDFPANTHGFHSVTITYTDIFLSSHPEGEDEIVFLWDESAEARPLYFVFALDKRERYVEKLISGDLDASDYVAVRFPVNDPRYSSFVVWHGTVHCELTDSVSPGTMAPSFFVLEPGNLTVDYTEETSRGIKLLLGADFT